MASGEDNNGKLDDESVTESKSGVDSISSSWNDSQEKLLKGIAERSNCMRWLHTQCNLKFESLNFYFTIPNVIISTLNGSFTMSLNSLFPDPDTQKVATTIIGLISIFSAVLITMNQYVKSQQMMEAHRAAALAYGKLYRMIMNELSIPRDQRSNGFDFLKIVKVEIDRLENTSPNIIPSVILKFNIQFASVNIEKPEIAGDLDPVEINHEIHRRNRMRSSSVSPIAIGNYIGDNILQSIRAGVNIIHRSSSSADLNKEADRIIVNMKDANK